MIDDTSDPFRSISHSINCSTVYISFCVPYIHDVTEEKKIYNIIQHVVYQVLYTTRYLVLLNKYGFSHSFFLRRIALLLVTGGGL